MTSAVIEERIVTSTNKPESSHIVMVPAGEPDQSPQAYVLRARIEGFPITALCGYTWIPNKNASNLPVCQECVEIYQQDGDNREEREELPDA